MNWSTLIGKNWPQGNLLPMGPILSSKSCSLPKSEVKIVELLCLLVYPLYRLTLVEDVRKHLSHIIYTLIFYFFLNFLLFVRLQTQDVGGRYNDIREASEI